MSQESLNLPIDIPWRLLAASPDMLDTQFCNKRFPFAWRSSLALSAYEPDPAQLPTELSQDRLTYLKVTCSITGYQPSKTDTALGYTAFPDVPTEQLDSILAEYFACYGALLNVAVFPNNCTDVTVVETCSPFQTLKVDAAYPNPYRLDTVTFTAQNRAQNRFIDHYPLNHPDGTPELDLANDMTIRFPTAVTVRAAVVHHSLPVTLHAFRGDQCVATTKSGAEKGKVYQLVIEHDDIDSVQLISPLNEAYLVSFCYSVRTVSPRGIALSDLPRIIDFEPKTRDLYQAATESGEILTASVAAIATTKSFTHTESSETGVALGATYTSPATENGQTQVSGGLSHKWGATDQDSSTLQTDASRDRRETQGTATTLSQLYNLLTGYHIGTNRAVFLMLPRPHILQPTDRRSFVQGVRVIEGVQDFFLIVSRPRSSPGLCVEAFLETAHFPEHVDVVEPPCEYDYKSMEFDHGPIVAEKPGFLGSRNTKKIDDTYSGFEDDVEGWRFDPTQGKPGRGGIDEVQQYAEDNAGGPDTGGGAYPDLPRLEDYTFSTSTPGKVSVAGTIRSGVKFDVTFYRKFRVFLRKQKQDTTGPYIDVASLLVTARGLCACLQTTPEGLRTLGIATPVSGGSAGGECIVVEAPVRMPAVLLSKSADGGTRFAATRELLRRIQSVLSTSWRLPSRWPLGDVGFLDSDYFIQHCRALLSATTAGRKLRDDPGVPASVLHALGEDCTVDTALKLDLRSFVRKTGVTVREAAQLRRILVGIREEPQPPAATDAE